MYVNEELRMARNKSAKPMLWVAMVSMTMMFAGLTSAYVISSGREDWVGFTIPTAFIWSTIIIILSSICFQCAKITLQKNNPKLCTLFLWGTLLLAIGFINFQYLGFKQLQQMGLFFTGAQSKVSSSLFMVIVFTHFLHLIAGLICILVVMYNHCNGKYKPKDLLGLELALIFWHFLVYCGWAYFIFSIILHK